MGLREKMRGKRPGGGPKARDLKGQAGRDRERAIDEHQGRKRGRETG